MMALEFAAADAGVAAARHAAGVGCAKRYSSMIAQPVCCVRDNEISGRRGPERTSTDERRRAETSAANSEASSHGGRPIQTDRRHAGRTGCSARRPPAPSHGSRAAATFAVAPRNQWERPHGLVFVEPIHVADLAEGAPHLFDHL